MSQIRLSEDPLQTYKSAASVLSEPKKIIFKYSFFKLPIAQYKIGEYFPF